MAIDIDKELADFSDSLLWPAAASQVSPLAVPGGLHLGGDLGSDFTERYVDILPSGWDVLSLSLSADNSEMIVSKLRKGRVPFLLRLPLRRSGPGDDDDEEQFTFAEGRDEMKEIIRLTNESAHAARSQNDRESRREWWRRRESLDRRLKTLLQNMENVWFGGFRGVFSRALPCCDEDDYFSRFRRSFEGLLDKHLPSRQKGGIGGGGGASAPRLTLHEDVLALFVGLGDMQDQECPEDMLMDLLYFVVDILQFQGERNAYDEIDFDIMVVETLDAVRGYHQSVRNGGKKASSSSQHTILVLDKALHCFPWESLAMLHGLPISRVPSLECLRDRILQLREGQEQSIDGRSAVVVVDGSKGSCIINPAGDLKTTQRDFEQRLCRLSNWTSVVNREPSEEEFKDSLASKQVFLYFGHGSGAQYIRARTIRRLSRCAVTFLMGCSSGTLTEAGEYEPYGMPMNYLHAGSPALVATLWDVTDKDIDRFAKSALENWGLIEEEYDDDENMPERFAESKKHTGAKSNTSDGGSFASRVALDEAVDRSRSACVFRYLTGAAPVVYGVPVVLE